MQRSYCSLLKFEQLAGAFPYNTIFNDVSAVFRLTAEGETGHAHGHMEYLEEIGGEPMGSIDLNLKAAIAGETHEYTDMYPGPDFSKC